MYRENTVASGKDEHYAYDDVNRLTVFDRGDLNANKDAITGTPVKEEDWGLDMTGNWSDFLQKTSGSTDLNQDRTHNPVNEITGITETAGTAWVDPVHDKAGNMTTLPKPSSLATGLTCKWDAWNRLVEVKQSATVVGRYEYDGLGRRAKSHVDSQSPANPNGVDAYVHFFYNQGWQELESRVSGSENTGPESLQPQYQYVWSRRYIDAPVLRDKNTDADGLCDDERLYYLGDANFNVTTLVNTGGDALERYVYSPYGVLTIYDATWANTRSASSYANVYTYTGRQLDTETGLFYYRARMFHAQLGRFISRDPIGYTQGSNIYGYVADNPVMAGDPSGMARCCILENPKPCVPESFKTRARVRSPERIYGIIDWSAKFYEDSCDDCVCACCSVEIWVRGTIKETFQGQIRFIDKPLQNGWLLHPDLSFQDSPLFPATGCDLLDPRVPDREVPLRDSPGRSFGTRNEWDEFVTRIRAGMLVEMDLFFHMRVIDICNSDSMIFPLEMEEYHWKLFNKVDDLTHFFIETDIPVCKSVKPTPTRAGNTPAP